MSQLLLVNPRKRRSGKKRKTSSIKRRKSTGRRLVARSPSVSRRRARRKSYRRNPLPGMGNMMNTVKNGAIGAAGALGVDFVWSKLPLGVDLKTGVVGSAIKTLVGIGTGMLVAKVLKNRSMGTAIAEGAVTVQLHQMMKSQFGASLGLGDGEFDDYDDLMGVGDYELLGMGDDLLAYDNSMYSDFDDSSMGAYTNAAPLAGLSAFTN